MSQMLRNKVVRAELEQLLRDNLIDASRAQRIAELYPLTKWNWTSLSRWFLIFGAISAVAGAGILLRNVFEFTYQKAASGTGVLMVALLAGGLWLRAQNFPRAAMSLELMAGFALMGLTFLVGLIYSDGSGNWPILLLFDLPILLALTYALNNPLLLILSAVVFFVWFGGRTGYESGWGMYWFGMNYPLRFFGSATGFSVVGVAHMLAEKGLLSRYRGFAKIWISFGIFLMEMALWLLSLFGNFGDMRIFRYADHGELFVFNAVWLALNLTLVYLGSRWRFGMLTGYGVTFFIIQLYTLFFAHIAKDLGWILSMFVAGGATLVLAVALERMRRNAANKDSAIS
jgi:hypothetical protein